MNLKAIISIAIIISTILLVVRISSEINDDQFKEGKYIHLDSMVMEFYEANATVNIEYDLNAFTYAYIFCFGSKSLEPTIKKIFFEFPDVKIQKVGLNSATIQLTNISRKYDHNYMHDSTKLGLQPDSFTIVYPYNQGIRKLQKPEATLSVFYPDKPENKNKYY